MLESRKQTQLAGNQSWNSPRKRGILIGVRIHLLYFGMLKDLFGAERDTLELPPGARVADALRILRSGASNPQSGIWDSLAVAVNREYAASSTPLHEADELALLPPVSGGLDNDRTTKADLR
ncbi:MAG TPA: MoaD/ThiS family protein [Granulicella sp.]|nr:MoaD/ThiS family protein [Granulicella sp.]